MSILSRFLTPYWVLAVDYEQVLKAMNKEEADYYAEGALRAAKRAAYKVAKKAQQENRAIPVWKNNRVEFEVPSDPQALIYGSEEMPEIK